MKRLPLLVLLSALAPLATGSPRPPERWGVPLRLEGRELVPGRIGGTLCCDDPRTPGVDEGLRDGWPLATDAGLDKLASAGLGATHFRSGPYSATGPTGAGLASARNRARARALEAAVANLGPGAEILPDLRRAVQAANARGLAVEVDLVDNWALVNGWNFYGHDCSITHGPPAGVYLDWVRAVVAATGDLAVLYNLGNEGFRCGPSEAWERGLYNETKAALASRGFPDRPVGSQVLLPNTRVALDYRTLGGVFVAPPPMEIPVALTEDDGGDHTPQQWWALAEQARQNGTYLLVWRGQMSDLDFDRAITGPPPRLAFYTVPPCRLLDTRAPGKGPALAAGEARTLAVAGACGVAPGARAVSLNVAVAQPSAPGHLRLFAAGSVDPPVSAINYRAGQTRSNNFIARLGAHGALAVRCVQAAGSAHVILDVNGYFE
jgi:hypothetical protein